MGNRKAILFFLLVITACAVLLFWLRDGVRLLRPEVEWRATLTEGVLDEVDHITIERGETRIGLLRQKSRWMMTAPFPAEVDQGAVQKFLDAFEMVHVKDAMVFSELRKKGLSLQELGFDPPEAHIILEGNKRRASFRIGAFSPLKTDVYVRCDDAEQILIVSAALALAVPRTADDIRSRNIAHGDPALVSSLEIRSPGQPFVSLARKASGWVMRQPKPAPASAERVEALLAALYAARVERFVWPTVSNVLDVAQSESTLKTRQSLYGLDAERGVQIQVQSSPDTVSKWVFGVSPEGQRDLAYVLFDGGEAIGLVSNAVAKAFGLSANVLRDARIFTGDATAVRRMKVSFGDTPFVLGQTNGVWQFESPISERADQVLAARAVSQLFSIREELPIGEAVTAAEPAPICSAEIISDARQWSFTVANDPLSDGSLCISFTNPVARFRTAATNLPAAFMSTGGMLAMRDKSILALPPASLRRITVKDAAGKTVQLEREKAESSWQTATGTEGQIQAAAVESFIARIADLQAERVEKLGVSLEDIGRYGFRQPWLEISLDVEASDAVRKTVLLGDSPVGGKRYAMLRGQNTLFVLDVPAVQVLSAPLVK